MASKYDDYWINRLDVVSSLIREAQQKGVSKSVDVSDITKYGERKSWYGDVVVCEDGISKGEMAHARSLGKVVFASGLINKGKFRFVISSNLKLRVERLETAGVDESEDLDQPSVGRVSSVVPEPNSISTILSAIPIEIWNRIVQEEPEWRYMQKFKNYGFGRFAVLMIAAGLNDFQLKGKAEVAYWPKIRELLELHNKPASISELESILAKFYSKERLPDLKVRRLNRFLSSGLAKWLWSAEPREVAENFLKIWHDLAAAMGQERNAKTIVFAMKCLGIALLMVGVSNFRFEKIPIPVDYRVREFTKRLGIAAMDDEDVRAFWNGVLEELKREKPEVNMIHLDSLIWQIGVLSKAEIVGYFAKLGLRGVGERIVEVIGDVG